MVHDLPARLRYRLSAARHRPQWIRRRGEMDRQFRHPDTDLCDAGLGPQHRGRPSRAARPRLCRLLRGRRLFLCAAGQDFWPGVLGSIAARRHSLLVLGHSARLSGAAPARRLSRDRHARLRRNHPHRHINWVDLTNGYAGISGIPRPTLFGIPFNADDNGFAAVFGLEFSPLYRVIFLYYVILALALLTAFVTVRLRRLPVGRAWEALREDEIACRSLGINTTNTKLTAFAMGAMFAGFAGSFFATRQGFISPESFTFLESA